MSRLHAFGTDGLDVTPADGVPLRGQVFWNSYLTTTMQPHAGDEVSYLILDRGPAGDEAEALHWERRDAAGALVARSEALVTAEDLVGTGNVWSRVTDDDAYLLYVDVVTPSTSVFARIEPDGRIGWLHRFEGFGANDERNRSRVQALEGGIVALVSRPDLSNRSVVRIASDGAILIAPGLLPLGREPLWNAALAADVWGFTVATTPAEAGDVTVVRYDWDRTEHWRAFIVNNSNNRFLAARPDHRGGTYVFELATADGTWYQHFDAFGRPAFSLRAYRYCPEPARVEIVFEDRPPLDAGIDAYSPPDAPRPVDAGTGGAMDAGADLLDAGNAPDG